MLIRTHAILCLIKTVVDPIVADLHSKGICHPSAPPLSKNRVVCVQSSHPAPVLLFELIAFNGIIQVVGEIGEQIEVVVKAVEHHFRLGMIVLAMPLPLQTVTLRTAPVGRIECAEEPDNRNGGDGYLVA